MFKREAAPGTALRAVRWMTGESSRSCGVLGRGVTFSTGPPGGRVPALGKSPQQHAACLMRGDGVSLRRVRDVCA